VMTSEEYVRDPEFKLHGIGVKIDNDKTFYIYTKDDVTHFLKTHPWNRSYVIGHHTHFDMAVLSWKAGIIPAFLGCTLSMSRAVFPWELHTLESLAERLGLPPKGKELSTVKDKWVLTDQEQKVLGDYCINDVDLTAAAFKAMAPHFPPSELRLIDLNIRLFTEPVLVVDRPVLVDEYRRERRAERALLKQCGVDKEILASSNKFAELLLSLGVDPPKKLSPSKVKDGRVNPSKAGKAPKGLLPSMKAMTKKQLVAALGVKVIALGKDELEETFKKYKTLVKEKKRVYPWAYAFGKSDEEFKMLEDHPSPHIRDLVAARFNVKSTIKETRSKRFYKIGKRGRFPVYHKYYSAKTGRDGGGDKQNTLNMTRVYADQPNSGALRRSWLAPKGHVLGVRDLSQIECRTEAYWAGQEDLLDLFRAGGDPYNRQASLIYGYEVNRNLDEFKLEGMAGKAATLGCGYQMGWGKFQESLRVGFMGMPSIMFTQEQAIKLGADVNNFCMRRSYKKECGTLRDEALQMKPLNVSETDHLWHCAAVWAVVDKYRKSNGSVVALWREMGNSLAFIAAGQEVICGVRPLVKTCREGIVLPNGMLIQYHKLKKNEAGEWRYLNDRRKNEWAYIYSGKVVENVVQALARIVMTDQMLRIDANLQRWKVKDPEHIYKVVTSTYDEVVTCIPEDRAEDTMAMMEREMATPPSWCADLPLKSSGGYAKSYGACEK
ncbi:hypothetical protein KAR91_18915, partial [Candidatus Pacearchaeota archaeon]|nr:hypothetical protein [Candidatus Pacearchaeota archaeon]